jgi:hypothetical protein
MLSVEPLTGAKSVTLAVNQEEYEPLTVDLFRDTDLNSPVLVSRWKLSQEERQALVDGTADIWLALSTFGAPPQPVLLQVGSNGLIVGSTYSNFTPILDAKT